MSIDSGSLLSALQVIEGLVVRSDEPLWAHTSLGLGGPARFWVEPSTPAQLQHALRVLAHVPLVVIGGGTNVLFDDRGFAGAVISTAALRGCTVAEGRLSALAGTPLGEVVRAAVEAGLGGLEWLCGIPGTVGGAVAGNAGAFGQETFDRLEEIRLLGPHGHEQRVVAATLDHGYRRGGLPPEHIVLEAHWALDHADPAALRDAMAQALQRRRATQPWGQRSAGCVFRNPPGESAGRLIDRAGLKGRRVGGAVVSTHHANFIVLDGPATSRDVRELIEIIRDRVMEFAGINLETELVIVEDVA